MVGRVIFPIGEQSQWINSLVKKKNLTVKELARVCEVSERTVRDWRREKFTVSEKALLKITHYFSTELPKDVKYVSDFWYVLKGARKGALTRLALYGPPGTADGRRKGGQISQQRRLNNPEKYRQLGCIVRKVTTPLQKSELLSEVVGIVLGDGGITEYQLKISLGSQTDRKYAFFVRELLKKVFNETPSWYEYQRNNVIVLSISGANLIEELSRWGLDKGNKIHRKIDFPAWIWEKEDYQKFCVRGLMDTDGGVYLHNHEVGGIKYKNLGICFTSWSKPLLTSFAKVLGNFGIRYSLREGRVYIYSLKEVQKYFRIFGSNNPKHLERLNNYLLEKQGSLKLGGVA